VTKLLLKEFKLRAGVNNTCAWASHNYIDI